MTVRVHVAELVVVVVSCVAIGALLSSAIRMMSLMPVVDYYGRTVVIDKDTMMLTPIPKEREQWVRFYSYILQIDQKRSEKYFNRIKKNESLYDPLK
jgi:hypothetical protein